MEGMTEELGGQSERGQDDISPVLPNDMPPIGKDSVCAPTDPDKDDTEPPPDWLKPLEDCEEEDDVKNDEVKSVKKRGQRAKKNVKAGRGRRSLLANKNNWEDCPDLGKGWKRKLIMWGDGKSAAYYLSPKGLRFRSKVQLARHLQLDLAHFDYKKGKFMDEVVVTKRKRRKAAVTEDSTHSSLPSSRTPTPDQVTSRFSENVPKTPKNGPRKPRRPKLSSISLSTPPAPNSLHISPAQLSRISPESLQHPSLSPSLRLNDLSAQTTSLPPLAPVSPLQTSENVPPTYLNGPNTHSTILFPHPTPQLSRDPDGGMQQHHGLPPMEGCANCGVEFPGMGKGKQLLCPKCRPSRKRSPHIVFRKVGKDKWVLGKSKKENLLKNFPSSRTKSPSFKSPRLNAQQEKGGKSLGTVNKESEDDDEKYYDVNDDIPEAFDNDEYGPRKRKRRMCGRCKACLREHDCRKCDFCLDKTKNGGPNKLRQKCRFRQCQVRSRLQIGSVYFTKRAALMEAEKDDQNSRKRSRSLARRKLKHRLWNRNVSLNEDQNDKDEEVWRPGKRGQRSRRRKWGRSLRRVKYDDVIEPIFEDGGTGDLVQDSYIADDYNSNGFYESEELYSSSYIQNGTNADVFESRHQPVMVEFRQFFHSHNGTNADVFESHHHQPVMVESRQFPHSHNGTNADVFGSRHHQPVMVESRQFPHSHNGTNADVFESRHHQPVMVESRLFPHSHNVTNADVFESRHHQPVMVESRQFPHSHELVYTVPGLVGESQIMGSAMCNGAPIQPCSMPVHPAHLQLNDVPVNPTHLQLNDVSVNPPPLRLSDMLALHAAQQLNGMPGTHAPLHLSNIPGISLQLSDMPGTHAPLQFSVIQDTPVPLQLGDVPDKAPPLQINEVLTSNGASLRLSDFLRSNGYELVEVDTVAPEILPDAHQEPEPQLEPQTLDTSPESMQSHSPTDSTEKVSSQNSGLLEMLSSLRRTTLPAHWVGVMTRGPVLQLFQCSKLSPMADTVLQIESDFLYQISVQNQPLLPTHIMYERHQGRLASVSDVVALLLDLEDFNVCQGYQSFEVNSQQEPLLCVRAALCQLLVPQNEECCEKCLAVIV
ncbi:methyl-CpG-binding domain protein 1a isoform X2 [Trichomycterus rosablanca]|uniref:methyl-CpG-binding domain protein 1a isoform X2 n=1 Tax=Trichomycterus rosablanca TaxID=2290929 RepID=UPI002F35FB40